MYYTVFCHFVFLFLFIRNLSRFRKKLILNLLGFKISCCLSYHTCRSKFKGWSYIQRIQYQKSIWDQRGKKKCRSKTATCLFNFISCNTNCKQDTTCIKSKRKLWSCHETPPSASSHRKAATLHEKSGTRWSPWTTTVGPGFRQVTSFIAFNPSLQNELERCFRKKQQKEHNREGNQMFPSPRMLTKACNQEKSKGQPCSFTLIVLLFR